MANGLVVHNCSEYMFLDDSACNLASINLMKFRRRRRHVRRRAVQGGLPACASSPRKSWSITPAIRRSEIATQQPSLPADRAGLLEPGQPDHDRRAAYDSDEARGLCGAITALLHGAACHTSTELAAAVGPFDDYEKNREPMLHVMEMHWEKVEEIKALPEVSARGRPRPLGQGARRTAGGTASATPRPRCWPPPARSAS